MAPHVQARCKPASSSHIKVVAASKLRSPPAQGQNPKPGVAKANCAQRQRSSMRLRMWGLRLLYLKV